MESNNDPPLLTVDEAAEMLKCSRSKVYDLHNAGAVDFKKVGPRTTRVTRESVLRFIADPQRVPSQRRLRPPAAAKYVGLSMSTLSKFRYLGGGPPYYQLGRSIVYDLQDLDDWLEANRFTSTAQAAASKRAE
jgi:excisionase family DNA binding protein